MKRIFILFLVLSFSVGIYGQNYSTKKIKQKNIVETNTNTFFGAIVNNTVKKVLEQNGVKIDNIVGTVDKTVDDNFYQTPKGIIQVGDGTSLERYPIYAFFGYSYTQSIYLASELGGTADNITRIWYYFAGTDLSSSNDWTVYMGHTSKTQFDGLNDWVDVASMTQVYSGSITNPGAPGWVEIDLTTTFAYDGTSNIVIAVDENAAGYNTIDDIFYNTATTDNRSMVVYSDTQNPDPASPAEATYNEAFIPNIRILFGDPPSHDLAVTNITPGAVESGATVTPTVTIHNFGVNDETSFDVTLTDGGLYTSNTTVTTTLSASGDLVVNMDAWTPADGNYTLTATVALSGDEDASNDVLIQNVTVAQIITMSVGNESTCFSLFYDTGSADADYQVDEDIVMTVSPGTVGKMMQITFNSYDIESGYDNLYIYNGTDTLAELLAVVTGAGAGDIYTAANPSGALTFHFASDGSVAKAGWEAILECVDPLQHDLAVIDVQPQHISSGSTVQPQVVLVNNALNDENSYSLYYTNYNGSYTGTQAYTDVVSAFGGRATLSLPAWSPVDGNDTLTVAVILAGDEVNSNDTLSQNIVVAEIRNAYAWDAYVSTSGLEGGTVNLLLPFGELSQIATNSGDFLAGADMINYDWYAGQYSTNNLLKVNSSTGEMTTVGTMGLTSVTGVAYDINTSKLYASDYDGTNSILYDVDIYDATSTLIGTTVSGDIMIGIACDNSGVVWGISLSDTLYKINTNTGEGTAIGALGVDINYAQDIAFDRDKGVLYGALYTTEGGLYSIDTISGVATFLATFGDEITGFAIPYTPVGAWITFTVSDGTNPIENATVTLDNGAVLTTDINGQDSIFLSENTFNYDATAFGYDTVSNSFTVVDGVDQNIDIVLTELPSYEVTFNVLYSGDDSPIENAAIVLTDGGTVTYNLTTDATGVASQTDVLEGDWTYSVSATGFNDVTDIALVLVSDSTIVVKLDSTVSISELNNNVVFYPNPSTGVFTVQVDNVYNLQIVDLKGREIYATKVSSSDNTVDMGNIPAGVYILKLSNETTQKQSKLIIK